MADAKIINYGQQISAGSTVIPDNNANALDIESTDAKDIITVSTVDGAEQVNIVGGGEVAKTLSVRSDGRAIWGNSNSFWNSYGNATSTTPNSGPRKSDWDTGIGSAADDELALIAGGICGICIAESGAVATTQINGPASTVGAFVTQGSGTVGTGGSSSTTLEQSSASTFKTQLHVGAAIKILSGGVIKKATVASITDANTLELDTADTIADGSNWYFDSGELFAVKTGDSKTLFAVDGTGAIQVGSAAADSNASNNIAIGDSDALDTIEQSGTNGVKNIIIGHADDNYKLTTGYSHVFIGHDAGTDVTTGHQCVAIGDIAMGAAQAGANLTTAVGRKAGYNAGNTGTYIGAYAGEAVTGYSNVAVGYGSMGLNGPDQGVAIGRSAHANCTGDNNVAIGAYSLDASGSAGNSVAIGLNALTAATGDYNVAVGFQAGDGVGSGGGNLLLGYQADCDASANYQIAIGFQVSTSAVSTAAIGDATRTATLNFGAAGQSWSTTSDERIKENVQDSKLGLDFINALRPITYTEINPQDWPEDIRPHVYFDREKTRTNEDGTKETYIEPAKEREATSTVVVDGLMAQEVKAAADAAGASFSGWEQQPNGLQRLQYEKFVLPLIAACQDLSAQVTALTARVAELEAGD